MKLTIASLTRIFRYFLFLGLLVYAASATTVSNAQTQTVTLAFNAAISSNAELSGFENVLHVTTSNSAAVESVKTVTVNVTGGTATAADYNRTGTITIPAGTAHNSLVSIASGITITDDSIRELNETITLSITSPSLGAVLSLPTTTTHTITDDETAYLAQSDSGASFSEDIGVLTEILTLNITGTAGGTPSMGIAASLDYYIDPLNILIPGVDYVDIPISSPATVHVPVGAQHGSTHTYFVTIIDDPFYESTEYFDVRATTSFNVGINSPSGSYMEQTWVLEDNDTAGVTMTQTDGATNVVEGGSTDDFTIQLTSQPESGTVTIGITTDGQCSVFPTSVTLSSSNWNVGEAVAVTAANDTTSEGAHTCAITTAVTDSNVHGYSTSTDVADVTANITDNDNGTVKLSAVTGSVSEGTSPYNMTVILALEDAATLSTDTTVQITSTNGTAGDSDYSVSTTSVTFPAGSGNGATQPVDVTITNDSEVEGGEAFMLTLGAVTGEATVVAPTAQIVIITDNDSASASTDLLVNGGFEQGLANGWKVQAASGDTHACLTPSKGNTGNCAFKFTGGTTDKSKLIQTVNLTGKTFSAGDTLDVSAYFKGNHTSAKVNITLFVYYTGVTQPVKTTLTVRRNAEYQQHNLPTSTLTSGDVSQIKVVFSHLSSGGTIFVDDVSMLHTVPGVSALGGSQGGMIAVPDAPADLRGN